MFEKKGRGKEHTFGQLAACYIPAATWHTCVAVPKLAPQYHIKVRNQEEPYCLGLSKLEALPA